MDSASPLDAGTTLGRYRIDALIGTGGMGAVYRAYDTMLKRPLAIKVLRDSSSHHQLLREAQNASALSHSAICTVYEVGDERGAAFIAMEFVDGEPLATKIACVGCPSSMKRASVGFAWRTWQLSAVIR